MEVTKKIVMKGNVLKQSLDALLVDVFQLIGCVENNVAKLLERGIV
jgi:hypothetical protein